MTEPQHKSLPPYHLHYEKHGNGSHALIALHGFGQSSNTYRPFYDHLSHHYTIYSFDIFYHGKSTWGNDEQLLEEVHLELIFSSFLRENDITTFSIAGYSMGGKIALALAKIFTKQIEELILIAPDGLYRTFWYKIATKFPPIRMLFKRIIDKPSIFFSLTKTIRAFGLVNKKVLQFAERNMSTSEMRTLVYYTWVNFRLFYYSRTDLNIMVDKGQMRILVFLGEYDRIISPKKLSPYFKGIASCELKIIESGHNSLIEHTANELKQIIQQHHEQA